MRTVRPDAADLFAFVGGAGSLPDRQSATSATAEVGSGLQIQHALITLGE